MKLIIDIVFITLFISWYSYLTIYKGIKDYKFHKKIDFFKTIVKLDVAQIALCVIVDVLSIAAVIVYYCF